MYFLKSELLVLEVPKCGSRTLVKAGKQAFGENYYAGHQSVKSIYNLFKRDRRNWKIKTVLRVIREPVDRFLSAVNYEVQSSNNTLDKTVDNLLRGRPRVLSSTQTIWLDHTGDFEVHTYRLEDMDKALEFIGAKDLSLWENKSSPRYSREDILNHPRYPEIVEKYKTDFKLWNSSFA